MRILLNFEFELDLDNFRDYVKANRDIVSLNECIFEYFEEENFSLDYASNREEIIENLKKLLTND